MKGDKMNKCERDAAIIELRRRGMTYKEIAQQIGCCLKVVGKAIRQYPGDDIQKEQFQTSMSFEQARDKYCPDGFDMLAYHPGQTKGYVELRCKQCGCEFTKQMVSFRGCWAKNKTHCPECDRQEREQREQDRQQAREKAKEQKEYERALAIKGKQLSFNVCPVCLETFSGRGKFCSDVCAKKARRVRYKHTRRTHIEGQMVDKDISLYRLALRDNDKCWICGDAVNWNDYVQTSDAFIAGDRYPSIDHVIPLSKHGLHAWRNVKLAHLGCNRCKGTEII